MPIPLIYMMQGRKNHGLSPRGKRCDFTALGAHRGQAERGIGMRHQRTLKKIGFCMVLAAVLLTGIFFRSMGQDEANVLTRGRVKIRMEDAGEGQGSGQEPEIVYVNPGEEISQNTMITVSEDSRPAYLRVALVTYGLNARQKQELSGQVKTGEGWEWNREDGYFYYEYQVKAGEEIPFCCRITIPEGWRLLEEQPVFHFQVMAEAVETACAGDDWNPDAAGA